MSNAMTYDGAARAAAGPESSIGGAYVLRRTHGEAFLDCAGCGHRFGPARDDPKLGACMSERSIVDLSTLNAVGLVDRLVARHFFCPSCGLLLAVNVQQQGDPIMLESSIDVAGLPAGV